MNANRTLARNKIVAVGVQLFGANFQHSQPLPSSVIVLKLSCEQPVKGGFLRWQWVPFNTGVCVCATEMN